MDLRRAYGLTIDSALPLRGLQTVGETAEAVVDVVVERGRVEEVPGNGSWHRFGPGRACLAWEGTCAIAIESGRRVVVDAITADLDLVDQVLLGPAMALLLQQRGLYPLHASAVQIGSTAVVFAGDSGAGKSSIGLALRQRGHRILADDIGALECRSGTTSLWQGPGSIRSWPDALTSIGVAPDAYEPLHDGTAKKLVVLDQAETEGVENPRVSRIYALRKSPSIERRALEGLEKVLTLLRHVCYPELVGGARGPEALLQNCLAIADTIDVTLVQQDAHYSASAEFLDQVEREALSVSSS